MRCTNDVAKVKDIWKKKRKDGKKMDNSDLEVAKMLNEHKTRAYGSLEEGVYIKEKLYEFERVSLFENKFSIMLPKDFVDMPDNIKKMKYLAEQRPQIIKTIPTGGVDIGFSLLDVTMTNAQLPQIFQQSKNAIRKLNPANVVIGEKQIEGKDKLLIWMDYISPALDGQMYNIMFLVNLGEYSYHGIFNCAISEMEAWKDVVKDILVSIQMGV